MKSHRPRTRSQKEKALMQSHRVWKKKDSTKVKKPVSWNFDDVEVSSDDEYMQNFVDSDDSDVKIIDGPSEWRSEMKEEDFDLGTSSCPIMMISDDESEEEEESEEGRGSGGGVGRGGREESEEEYESETEESESEADSESEGEEESESESEDAGYGFTKIKVESNSKKLGRSKKSVNKIPVKKYGSGLGTSSCSLALTDDESDEESEDEDAGYGYRDSRNDFLEKIEGENKREMKKGSFSSKNPSESRSKMKKNSSDLRTSSYRVTRTDDESDKEKEASYNVRNRGPNYRKETEGKKEGEMKKGIDLRNMCSSKKLVNKIPVKKNGSVMDNSSCPMALSDDESEEEPEEEDAGYGFRDSRNDFLEKFEGGNKREIKKGSYSNKNPSESRSKMKKNSSNLRTSSYRVMRTDDESEKEKEASYNVRDRGTNYWKETEGKKKGEMKIGSDSRNMPSSKKFVNKIPVKKNGSVMDNSSCPMALTDDESEEEPEEEDAGYGFRDSRNDFHEKFEGENMREMKKGSYSNKNPSESRSKMKKNSSNLRTSSYRVTSTDDESEKEEEASYNVRDRGTSFRNETEGKKKGEMKKGRIWKNVGSSKKLVNKIPVKKNVSDSDTSSRPLVLTDGGYGFRDSRNDSAKKIEGVKKRKMKKGSDSNESPSGFRSKMKENSSNLQTSSSRVKRTYDESEKQASFDVRDRGNDFHKETDGKKEGEMKKGRNLKNVGSSRISVNKIHVKENRSDLGTSSSPLPRYDDESEEKPEESVGGGGKEDASYYVRETGNDFRKETEGKTKGETEKRSNSENVRNARISVNKLLVDSIWEKGGAELEKGGAELEKLVSERENSPDEVGLLPLIFSFDSDEDIEVPEKSYWDLEAEKLFEEMDYVLELLSLGSSDVDTVDFEENITLQTKKDLGCCLNGGKHHFVLNEEVGISCTICHFVLQEIRNYQPEFGKPRCRRGGARDFYRVDGSNKYDFENEEFTATDHSSFKHPKGTVWDLIPGIRNSMFPHQQEGFEFIWKNIADSIFIEEAKKCISEGGGNGCIITHAPGTGKTRLAILFLQTYMKLDPDSRPVIIAPCSMLLTWEEEFRKWNIGVPFHNLNISEYSNQESPLAISFLKKNVRQGRSLETSRLVKLFSWRTEKSVLGISYQLFEELCSENNLVDMGKKKDTDLRAQIRKMLLELPGILVLDEGHIPRNNGSQILRELLQVQTKRKIMLSGTPFQNNFEELWNTFRLVRRRFPQDVLNQTQGKSGIKGKRAEEEAKAEFASMTNNIGKVSDEKAYKLKKIMSEFVHVYKGLVLKEKLPGLRDFVVVLSPTNLQKKLIEEVEKNIENFKRDHLLTLISIHPSLFPSSHRDELESLTVDPNAGVKTRFLTELIRLSWALKERVLVFSQFIDPLKMVIEQLRSLFCWTEGKEILFMTGEHNEKQRQLSINLLNDSESDVRVMLASTRACSEGINLVGASRVVLLDVVWNPSIKRQSISRAYRLGQKKVVHVYHLIAGKWEWDKYRKQAGKDRISDLVFSAEDGAANKPQNLGSVDEDKVLQDMVEHPSLRNIFIKVQNQSKDSDLLDMFD